MLSLERRKTDTVDWVKPLSLFIRNQYDANAERDHQEAITYVHKLREDVRNSQDKNDGTKDLLYQYYGILECIEKRFPISENNVSFFFVFFFSLKNIQISCVFLFLGMNLLKANVNVFIFFLKKDFEIFNLFFFI